MELRTSHSLTASATASASATAKPRNCQTQTLSRYELTSNNNQLILRHGSALFPPRLASALILSPEYTTRQIDCKRTSH